jgi:hypothetical protein
MELDEKDVINISTWFEWAREHFYDAAFEKAQRLVKSGKLLDFASFSLREQEIIAAARDKQAWKETAPKVLEAFAGRKDL